jgi:hypothetical protein
VYTDLSSGFKRRMDGWGKKGPLTGEKPGNNSLFIGRVHLYNVHFQTSA